MCTCPQWQHFLWIIWKTHFSLLLIRESYLSQKYRFILSQKEAALQNRLLKCVYSVFNIIKSMCLKVNVHIPEHISQVEYIFGGSVQIAWRPYFIQSICDRAIILLNLLQRSYICFLQISNIPRCLHVSFLRVHFYSYLLTKCSRIIDLIIDSVNIVSLTIVMALVQKLFHI